jgi:hypothetical protein
MREREKDRGCERAEMTSSFPKSAMHGGEMGVRTPLKGGGTKKRKKMECSPLEKKAAAAAAALRELRPLQYIQ